MNIIKNFDEFIDKLNESKAIDKMVANAADIYYQLVPADDYSQKVADEVHKAIKKYTDDEGYDFDIILINGLEKGDLSVSDINSLIKDFMKISKKHNIKIK